MESFLSNHRKVGIDTCVFIYQVEANPKYVDLTQRIFDWLERSGSGGVTSTITMLELLVQPYREDDPERVDGFYALLSTYPHLEWCPLTLAIADRASHLRATHNLRAPDAVQAATALVEKASGFISNDPAFRRIDGLTVLLLDDLRVT